MTLRLSRQSARSSATCFRSGCAFAAASVFCAVWVAIAAATRYSSLAALIASAAAPAFLWWRGDVAEAKVFLLLSLLLWIMHRANIARLVSGTEGKIGDRSSSASAS
jgi:glycerol-3-phosphate acyltransferase PlsY